MTQKYVPALYATSGHMVTGCNHGDAFGKLLDTEKDEKLISGFYDPTSSRFLTDDGCFYIKTIILVRHAEAANGRNDPPITDNGVTQARAAASRLAKLNLQDFVGFTSPMVRCRQTAELLHETVHLDFQVDHDLRDQEEDAEGFFNRVQMALDRLPARCIVVTHYDVVVSMIRLALGQTVDGCLNASVNIITDSHLTLLGVVEI